MIRIGRAFGQALKGLSTEKDRLATYQHAPTDVVCAVPAKSGTTWVMHIAHQLRMRGAEPDFEDQMDVMPWIEGGPALALQDDVNLQQPGEPRIFKSHFTWKQLEDSTLPTSLKVIYCFRDLKDVLKSVASFLPPIVHLEVPEWVLPNALSAIGEIDSQLNSLCDFWEQRHNDRVCFLFYDDLKERHLECVQRIQRFMQIEGGDSLAEKVVEQSTHAYMSRPDMWSKFSDFKIAYAIDRRRGITRTMPLTGKVRKSGGKSGEGEACSKEVKSWLDWRWECVVYRRTGFADLKAMRKAWAEECKKN